MTSDDTGKYEIFSAQVASIFYLTRASAYLGWEALGVDQPCSINLCITYCVDVQTQNFTMLLCTKAECCAEKLKHNFVVLMGG